MRKPIFTRISRFVLSGFSAIVLLGCTTDFPINAPYKETGAAYMLLSKTDSVQYLKLNRLYINTEGSANDIAKIEDSLYFNDADVEVLLIEGKTPITLKRIRVETKQSGLFANPGEWIYRTPAGYVIDETKPYTLSVKNKKTGYEMTANTRIVKDGSIVSPLANMSKVSFATCKNDLAKTLIAYIDRYMTINSAKDAKFYDFDLIFHYREHDPEIGIDTIEKSLQWPVARGLSLQTTSGGAKLNQKIDGEVFFAYIADHISPKEGVKRYPVSVEFVFSAGGQALYDYINVNSASLGIVQKKAEYSNFENGMGLFSSRSKQSLTFPLDYCTTSQLSNGDKTGHLGFVR